MTSPLEMIVSAWTERLPLGYDVYVAGGHRIFEVGEGENDALIYLMYRGQANGVVAYKRDVRFKRDTDPLSLTAILDKALLDFQTQCQSKS